MIQILTTGMTAAEDCNGRRLPPPNMSALRAAWERHGERLTQDHVEEHPGTRPWGFWAFGPGRDILTAARRQWPLTCIGRQGGVSIRNRAALSSFEQRRLLAAAGLLTPGEGEE